MSASLLTDFEVNGFCQLGSVVPRELTDAIVTGVQADRVLSSQVFLSQEGFEKAPEFRGVNPRAGRNVLEHIPDLIEELEALPPIMISCAACDRCLPDFGSKNVCKFLILAGSMAAGQDRGQTC